MPACPITLSLLLNLNITNINPKSPETGARLSARISERQRPWFPGLFSKLCDKMKETCATTSQKRIRPRTLKSLLWNCRELENSANTKQLLKKRTLFTKIVLIECRAVGMQSNEFSQRSSKGVYFVKPFVCNESRLTFITEMARTVESQTWRDVKTVNFCARKSSKVMTWIWIGERGESTSFSA